MRQWLRRFRGYLIVLPVALAVGFGFQAYQAWTGNTGFAHDPVDVRKGETAKLGPATMQLLDTSVKTRKDADRSSLPKNAVLVTAHFRGRIDDAEQAKKQKFIACSSTVENGDGWRWEAGGDSCTGTRRNSDFEEVKPTEGEWYEFKVEAVVPKDKAYDLRPTLGFYREFPRYLRFEV